jgi:hypothetical protein
MRASPMVRLRSGRSSGPHGSILISSAALIGRLWNVSAVRWFESVHTRGWTTHNWLWTTRGAESVTRSVMRDEMLLTSDSAISIPQAY